MDRARQPEEERRCARVALKPIKNVVVGLTVSEGSEAVVGAAVDIAKAAAGRLTIVHSVPTDFLVPSSSAAFPQTDLYERWSQMQRKEVATRIEQLGNPVPLESRIESGPPHRAILNTADAVSADLIVIGASDRGRIARFLGGTADRVLRRAKCPVLVVRGDWEFPIERVLMPVDFSMLSAEAYDCGLCFLSQIGAPATLIELFYAGSEHQRAVSGDFSEDRMEEFVLRELEHFGRKSSVSGEFTLSCRTSVGEPAREILKETDRFGAGLVVVGTNGQGGFEKALLGSVAKAVATEARCPVLFIPPEVALGAAIAEAVLEQTEPRWRTAETGERAARAAAERGVS